MNGFVLLSASMFIYFTGQILDDGFCDSTNLVGLQRDPNKEFSYANFVEHFYHVLDVSNIEGVAVQTGSQCLMRCVDNDRCFSTNIGAFHLQNGKLWCYLLPTDKYNTSEKFKTNHTFHHYSIWSPCASFPCQHCGTCRALYKTGGYSCICKQYCTGKNCENCDYSHLTWYQVVTKTGSVTGAATDGQVYIRINGTIGYIENVLDDEDDDFELGREDIFTFQGNDYIGALRSVNIKRNSGTAWYLEKISVARSFSKDEFKDCPKNAYGIQCSYNDWVDAHKWIQLKNE